MPDDGHESALSRALHDRRWIEGAVLIALVVLQVVDTLAILTALVIWIVT